MGFPLAGWMTLRHSACKWLGSRLLLIWALALSFAPAARATYLSMEWTPAEVVDGAGVIGTRLIAGVNYTKWVLLSDSAIPIDQGQPRLMLVEYTMSASSALSGECPTPLYSVDDRTAPLDGTVDIPAVSADPDFYAEYNSPADGPPMVFSQGGLFRLCFSPDGSFGIGRGILVPNVILNSPTTYRVYGATDTCTAGPLCLAQRRFFCYNPSSMYAHYHPTGRNCSVFLQRAYAPVSYLRLTWMGGITCASDVGMGMELHDTDWSRELTTNSGIAATFYDLGSVDLGATRMDLSTGFVHRLCLCPAHDHDATDELSRPLCAWPIDFVQQVGILHGFMVTFLGIDGAAKWQVLTMTRFSIRVDCGNGPNCRSDTVGRIKVIDRGWDMSTSTADNMHWDATNGCRTAVETEAWYSPDNCRSAGGTTRLADGCLAPASAGANAKVFGDSATRFLPKVYSRQPVAQIFHVCFKDNPPAFGENPIDPASDDALQDNPQMFWKVGELVVEPYVVILEDRFVVGRNVQVKIGPPDVSRTSIAYGSESVSGPGPIIKVFKEQQSPWVPVDIQVCHSALPVVTDIIGFSCTNSSHCMPRAVEDGNTLVLRNDVDGLRLQQPGIYGVCYCEAWASEAGACEATEHWVFVGRVTAAGPVGDQIWTLDTGMIQTLELIGYGFSDNDVIRIIQRGQSCFGSGSTFLETSVKVCLPALQGECAEHSLPIDGLETVTNIAGAVKQYNTTFPIVYLQGIEPSSDGFTLLRFDGNPVIAVDDLIVLEDNVQPLAAHWVEQRDLSRIVQDKYVGHRVLDSFEGGHVLKVPISLDPWPQFVITPSEQGRWRQNNKWRAPFIKGNRSRDDLVVCWSSGPGEEARLAGTLNFRDPATMPSMAIGLAGTANGTVAPIWITFRTGTAPRYVYMENSTQLRLTFTDSFIMAPATSSDFGEEAQQMFTYDQVHEASQAVCGLFFRELWSSAEHGFPVPKGCYYEHNLYSTANRMRAVYILFEARNGIKEDTEYSIVMNAKFNQPMSLNDYSALSTPLIEVALLDDLYTNPEGVLEVQWANPDKAIQTRASVENNGQLFFDEGGFGGVSVIDLMYGNAFTRINPVDDIVHDLDAVVEQGVDNFGFNFLLRGSEAAPIQASALLRMIMLPLTSWSLSYLDSCVAECQGQDGYSCGQGSVPGSVRCEKASVISYCSDSRVVGTRWTDTRGIGCEYYADPETRDRRCIEDAPDFIPWHGVSAFHACCDCGGGDRYASNELRLNLPTTMDPAQGSEIIHTVRVWGVGGLPEAGFFPTRWAVEMWMPDGTRPDFTFTTGPYFRKSSDATWLGTTASLIAVATWGNSKPFKAETELNDFYLRVIIPATMFSSPNFAGESRASITITLPPGYQCRAVMPAYPREDAATGQLEQLPVLPASPATGNGNLPLSTGEPSRLDSAAGSWRFASNQCIFDFGQSMALFSRQSLYLHILALNPVDTLPYTDVTNRWYVQFSSSGAAIVPPWVASPAPQPCGSEDFGCNPNISLTYYVNPLGLPFEARSYTPLHPVPSAVRQTLTQTMVQIPLATEVLDTSMWTDRFSVLGRIEEVVVQPNFLHLLARVAVRIWFVPDLGFDRGGILGVDFPDGFVLDNPCTARELDHAYYASYAPPQGSGEPRVFPIGSSGECTATARYGSFEYELNRLELTIFGALVVGRHYGFEAEVRIPSEHQPTLAWTEETWTFKVFISDDEGYLRDGTYDTGIFIPGLPDPWEPYYGTVSEPIQVVLSDLRPFSFVEAASEVRVYPIIFPEEVRGYFRVYAPEGFVWAWDPLSEATFRRESLLGVDVALMPGGFPALPSTTAGKPNIIYFPEYGRFLANTYYGFETFIEVPKLPPRASGNTWYFEWGYNSTAVEGPLTGRAAAASADGAEIRAMRGAKAEVSSSLIADDSSLLWLWIETITDIHANGSLEIRIPYFGMMFHNFTDSEGRDWCIAQTMESLGSQPMPEGLLCRRVVYPEAVLPDNQPPDTPEVRITLTNNLTGFPAGHYVFEFNITTPNPASGSAFMNPQLPSDSRVDGCGSRYCLAFFAMSEPYDITWSLTDRAYTSEAIPRPQLFTRQSDYFTSIPVADFHTLMQFAGIMGFPDDGLDERLATGRDDRPYARNSIVFGFSITQVTGGTLYIRAPYGWYFDANCEAHIQLDDVFPYPPGLAQPTEFVRNFDGATVAITPWESGVRVDQCRGDGHNAEVDFSGAPIRGALHVLRVSVQANPAMTPERNTWSITYGTETSGALPGFDLWTMTNTSIHPVNLAWTPKEDPLITSVTVYFKLTNSLIGQAHADARFAHLVPYLRVVLPAQFEVVRDGAAQDLQGGECTIFITKIGDCRRCGVPLDPFSVTCNREINRMNAAWIGLIGEEDLTNDATHALSFNIYNPHIVDASDAEPRTWQLDTWIGEPHGVWMHGIYGEVYAIDAANLTGYLIVEKAEFDAEIPLERNGSSIVDPKRFRMKFAGVLEAGDQITLSAPSGFETSMLVAGLIDRIICMDFEYLPLPLNRSSLTDRGVVPNRLPAWAADGVILEEVPNGVNVTVYDIFQAREMGFQNVSTSHIAIRSHCLHEPVIEDMQDADLLDRPLPSSDLAMRASHPHELTGGFDWMAMPEGAEVSVTLDREALWANRTNFSGGFLNSTADMMLMCLRATWRVNATVNRTVYIRRNATNHTETMTTTGVTMSTSASATTTTTVTTTASQVQNLSNISNSTVGLEANSSNTTNASSTTNSSLNASLDMMNATNATSGNMSGLEGNMSNTTSNSSNQTMTQDTLNASNSSNPSSDSPVEGGGADGDMQNETEWELYTFEVIEEQDRTYTECFFENTEAVPPGSAAGKVRFVQGFNKQSSWWSSAKDYFIEERTLVPLFGGPGLYAGGPYVFIDPEAQGDYELELPRVTYGNAFSADAAQDVLDRQADDLQQRRADAADMPFCQNAWLAVEVEWESPLNLTQELGDFTAVHDDVLSRMGFDLFPVQVEPMCSGETVTFTLTADNIHPDLELRNNTWIDFLMGFRNPVRPMYDHENYWTVIHSRNGRPMSSGTFQGWQIISQLLYVKMDLLTEVLRPSDVATIHIEFVTVNFADTLHVLGLWPQGYIFDNAVVLNQEAPQDGQRRLQMWQGFTQGVSIHSAGGPELVLKVADGMARNEYVRIDIGGVLLPWEGGQAYFDIWTSLFSVQQDELRNCCDPGTPEDNPAEIFTIPHHFEVFSARLLNEYQESPLLYPIEYYMTTRFAEDCRISFNVKLKVPLIAKTGSPIVIIVRSPPNYVFAAYGFGVQEATSVDNPTKYRVQVLYAPQRMILTLPDLAAIHPDNTTQINLRVRTPEVLSNQIAGSLWVIEFTDADLREMELASPQIDAHADMVLEEHLEFSISAALTPPNVIITMLLTIVDLGIRFPVQLELYAPLGFSFLSDCMASDADQVQEAVVLREVILSCRERRKLFGAVALSGAIMMTVDGGIPEEHMPAQIALRVQLADVTPSPNKWYMQAHTRDEPAAWDVIDPPFVINAMTATTYFSAMSLAEVSLFLSVWIRFPLEWGSHLHFQAPMLYQLNCPVANVLSGAPGPRCTQDSPVLQACFGHPAPDGGPPEDEESALHYLPDLPRCDPRHELLLTFSNESFEMSELLERFATEQQQEELMQWMSQPYAIMGGEDALLLYTFTIRVAEFTPAPAENLFKVKILDPNYEVMDGKLNIQGPDIRNDFVVTDFSLWWNNAQPNSEMTVAIDFTFQSAIDLSNGAVNLTTVEIQAPGGLSMAIRRPADVIRLTEEPINFVQFWSWADSMPNRLWFSLDTSEMIESGARFHYAFDVVTPSEDVGIGANGNNFWLVKFCGDMPYCQEQILSVPLPGYDLGSRSPFELSDEAVLRLTGSSHQVKLSGAVIAWLLLGLWLGRQT